MIRRLAVFTLISFVIFSAPAAFAKGSSIIKVAENIDISRDATITDVVAVGGNVNVSGRVDNSVVAVGGSVTLGPNSYVGGEVVVVGGELIKDNTAVVSGKITLVSIPNFVPSASTLLKGGWITLWATISLLVILGFLGLAILLVALIPENIGTAVNALERSFAWMLFWGMFWAVMIIPIAVLLAISIIGIILIPLEILLVALALIIGYIASAVFIGKSVFLSFKKAPPPFVDAILGIIILSLVAFVPIIGPLAKVVFLIAGFGAVATTRFGTIK